MIKHYIFDMGGVLLKQIPYKLIENEVSFVNCTTPEVEKIFWDNFYEYEKGNINTEKFVKNLRTYFNKKDLTTEEYEQSYFEIGEKYGGVFENAYKYVKKIKDEGNKVYLLSNLHELSFKDFSKVFDTSIFDKLFLSYEIGLIKPDDEIFKYVIKEIGDKPNNMCFFDDKLENVNSAKRNGMNAIQTTGDTLAEAIETMKSI